MLFAYSHKHWKVSITGCCKHFCYYVFSFLEVTEVYSHFIYRFLIAKVLLSCSDLKVDVYEARMIGFICKYALMAYGIKANKWVFCIKSHYCEFAHIEKEHPGN